MSVALLIGGFALAVFLLLEFEDLLERGLGDGGGDVILAVEVLDKSYRQHSISKFTKVMYAPLRLEEEHSRREQGKCRAAHRRTASRRRFVRWFPEERDLLNNDG